MKFVIQLDKLLKEMSPSEYFGIVQGNQIATYNAMLKCVTDDSGNPLTGADAKHAIDSMSNKSMSEFARVQNEFIKAFTDVLVNPTSGNG